MKNRVPQIYVNNHPQRVPVAPTPTSVDLKNQKPTMDRGVLCGCFVTDDPEGPQDLLTCPTKCLSRKLNLER